MAVNEWDFMEQCYLDTVQLVVCQSKIYFPQKKKKTLNKIKLEVWFTLADRIHSEMPSRTARQY